MSLSTAAARANRGSLTTGREPEELRELVSHWGAELELAPAEVIIEWAAATFGERFRECLHDRRVGGRGEDVDVSTRITTASEAADSGDRRCRKPLLQKLHERVLPVVSSETTHLSPDWPFPPAEFSRIEGVTFRLKPRDKSGRYEKSHALLQSFFCI